MPTMESAILATAHLKLFSTGVPSIVEAAPGAYSPCDLPLKDMSVRFPAVKHFVDIIDDFEFNGLFTPDLLRSLCEDPAAMMPDASGVNPLALKKDPGCTFTLQVFVYPRAGDKVCIAKHVILHSFVKGGAAMDLCQGRSCGIAWGKNVKSGMKGFQHLLQGLGGFQRRYFTLSPAGAHPVGAAPAADGHDAGFDFIEEHAPRSGVKNAQLRWMTKELAKEDSPIYKWSPGLVEKALRNLAGDGVLAMVCDSWPLTMKHVSEWMLDIFHDVAPFLDQHGLVLLGEPGIGKTPFARIIATMKARVNISRDGSIKVPSYRSASELDFFRGQPGERSFTDIFDDGDMSEQPVKKMKAFLDVGDLAAMSRERWGAAKWVQGQCRIACANQYDRDAEPRVNDPAGFHDEAVTHVEFMEMLRVTFPADTSAVNKMAILKRGAIIVNTKKWLYIRLPSEVEHNVRRVRLPDNASYLTEEGGRVYMESKRGKTATSAADFEEAVAWELLWMETAFPQEPDLPEEVGAPGVKPEESTAKTEGAKAMNKEKVSEKVETVEKEAEKMPLTQELEALIAAGLPAVKQEVAASSSGVMKKESVTSSVTFAQRLATRPMASIDLCSPSPPAKKLRRAVMDEDDEEDVFDHGANIDG